MDVARKAPFVVLLPACVQAGGHAMARLAQTSDGQSLLELRVALPGRPHDIFVTESDCVPEGWNFDGWESMEIAGANAKMASGSTLSLGVAVAIHVEDFATPAVAFSNVPYSLDEFRRSIVPVTVAI